MSEDKKWSIRGTEFDNQFLLEDYRQKSESFRWYSSARLTINRFFLLFFVAVSGLIGYLGSTEIEIPIISEDKEISTGIILLVGGIIGWILIWANVGFGFEVKEHSLGIWHYQSLVQKTKEYLKSVREVSNKPWIKPNFLQLICMFAISTLFIVIGLILLYKICWVFTIGFLAALLIAVLFIYYYRNKNNFGKKREQEIKEFEEKQELSQITN